MIAVFNCENFAPSEYHLDWPDVAAHNGQVYGLDSGAVQRLSGTIESTARPYVETGALTLATGAVCNVSRAYLELRNAGSMVLTATATQGRDQVGRYPVPARAGDDLRARTVPLGRGPRGNSWAFRLASTGGAWSLGAWEIVAERIGRMR